MSSHENDNSIENRIDSKPLEGLTPVKKRRWLLLIPLVILIACGAIWIGRQIAFQMRYAGMPIAAQTGGFAPDCMWGGKAIAWIDENANGVHDASEPPFPDMKFYVDDVENFFEKVGWGISDWYGEAEVSVWLPGCPEAKFEVYPEVPSGYRLTTPARLSADVREYDQAFEFGFTYIPGIPTVTPRPLGPQCTTYKIAIPNQYDLTDLAAAPDATVWAATFGNGVSRYFPGQDKWVTYGTQDGLVSNRVRSITISEDGVVWFAADGGASCFDGSGWVSYTASDGLAHNNVYKIAIGAAGTVWFATQGGVSRLQLETNTWTSYTTEDGLADDFVTYVAVASDKSIWFPTVTQGVSRLVLPDNLDEAPTWITYSEYGGAPIPFDFIDDIDIAPDGACWFAGLGGITQFDLTLDTWTVYDYSSTNGAFADTAHALEFAPDGSIWVASGSRYPVIYHFIPAREEDEEDIWRKYDTRDGLPKIADPNVRDDRTQAIAIVSNNEVWIGTREAATRCIFPGQ
jgi:streptogramin lyase